MEEPLCHVHEEVLRAETSLGEGHQEVTVMQQRWVVPKVVGMAFVACLVVVGAVRTNSVGQVASIGGSSVGFMDKVVVEKTGPWKCHRYQEGETDEWCKAMGTQGGFQYIFVGYGSEVCEECWCCKRTVE